MLLQEDLNSPCTEEIARIQAFSRIIQEAGKKFVVMDTAQQDILCVLDATSAYHREMSRQMGSSCKTFNTYDATQDAQQTKVLIVTQAETTPVLRSCPSSIRITSAPVLNHGRGLSIIV